jgi:3-dehydroquinate dehydratase-1
MICVAISDRNLETCLSVLDAVQMAEIRLDLTDFTADEIRTVFSHKTITIATCRPDKKGAEYQLEQLSLAIQTGADYVDIEIEANKKQRESIYRMAKKHGCKVIISYHNFENTPELKELQRIMDQCYLLGADVAKIVTMSHSNADNACLLSLYSKEKPLVAFGMGKKGKITRIMAPLLGAEFTFAAMDVGEPTAAGQIGFSKMKMILEKLKEELI